MMLVINRTKSSFTIIEILFCVIILSIGIVGILSSYIITANALGKTETLFNSIVLIKEKMSEIEEKCYKDKGISAFSNSGDFAQPYNNFSWYSLATSEEKLRFCQISLNVICNSNKNKYSLFTYLPTKFKPKGYE